MRMGVNLFCCLGGEEFFDLVDEVFEVEWLGYDLAGFTDRVDAFFVTERNRGEACDEQDF
jgi:hypothetical protein